MKVKEQLFRISFMLIIALMLRAFFLKLHIKNIKNIFFSGEKIILMAR